MKTSKTEGKLVAGFDAIIDIILKKVGKKIEKDIKTAPERAISLLNQIGSIIGHKVTTDKQQNGKIFLKFGEEVIAEFDDSIEETRNYRKEYDNYQSRPEQKLRRAARNAARRSFKDVPEDKDVHHKDNNPMNNDKSNLSVVTQKYNRSEPRLREKKLKEWLKAAEVQEDMGTVTGPHIAGTGDDSSTVIVKKKRMLKRMRDTINYNKKGNHVK
jgi:hypothetical protein|tara:strand:+ start:505 stop:1146 length:642 start_codon:yes stop_codon:yes gene_type:complete